MIIQTPYSPFLLPQLLIECWQVRPIYRWDGISDRPVFRHLSAGDRGLEPDIISVPTGLLGGLFFDFFSFLGVADGVCPNSRRRKLSNVL